jgi:hypothetical protein
VPSCSTISSLSPIKPVPFVNILDPWKIHPSQKVAVIPGTEWFAETVKSLLSNNRSDEYFTHDALCAGIIGERYSFKVLGLKNILLILVMLSVINRVREYCSEHNSLS